MKRVRQLLRHCAAYVRHYGLRDSLTEAGPFLRELISGAERKAEAAEDFDRTYGTDTAEPVMPWELASLRDQASDGRPYETLPPHLVREMLSSVPAVSQEKYDFVDLGSGKGRVLLLASEMPFARIIGVEHSRELHEIANRNLQAYRSPLQKCQNVELILGKAENYSFEPRPTIIFMYNPFKLETIQRVVHRLHISFAGAALDAFIIYANPRCSEAFESHSIRLIRRAAIYNIYQIGGAATGTRPSGIVG